MPAVPVASDLREIKAQQQSAWVAGDYAAIGTTLQLTGELLCEAVDVVAGELVLDVATGNGNAALAAARRGAVVTASDFVGQLLGRTGARAAAEGLAVELQPADAENLPFDDATFDLVLSTFGVMFTPEPDVAATELLRVCRPGGRIGLANWTPSGFVGQMFDVVGRHVPLLAGLPSPFEWGEKARLHGLLDDGVSTLTVTPRVFIFRYRSARHWLDAFRIHYGPVVKAFATLDRTGRDALDAELLALARAHDTSTAGVFRVPSEYVEVVAIRDGRAPIGARHG
jgi:ubiquinone/menaquinone biosynthesis C-methylase UbiE